MLGASQKMHLPRDGKSITLSVFLALLILAASGGDPSLGQEEFAAGTDTDLIETLSIPRNTFLAQGQAWHAHCLSIQHQLHSRQRGEQGQYKGEQQSCNESTKKYHSASVLVST